MTLAPNAERLAVELSLPVLTTKVCRGLDSSTQPSACGAKALTQCCATAAASRIVKFHQMGCGLWRRHSLGTIRHTLYMTGGAVTHCLTT